MNSEAAALMRTTRRGSANGSLSSTKKHQPSQMGGGSIETRDCDGGGTVIACTSFYNQNTSPIPT